MTPRLIPAVLAASLALTPMSAAPARAADGEDIARFLAGATALFIIGKALSDANDDRRVRREYKRHVEPDRAHRPRPGRHLALPGACLRTIHGRHGPARVFGRHCLRRHAAHVPNVCRQVWHGPRGNRVVFPARCLRRHGYRVY